MRPRPGPGISPGTPRKPRSEERPFIAWDGEGINLSGPGRPQAYVLFGSSEDHIESTEGLSAFDCLDHIISTGQAHPHAVHVGFAFSYDANMIVQSLSPVTLARLHRHGFTRLRKKNGERYSITFAKGKFFRVTKYRDNYHPQHNPHAKTTVTIYDIFSFFATSFVSAYTDMLGPISNVISAGKKARGEFSLDQWDEVVSYWTLEIQLLRDLAQELRTRVYDAGLKITQWHGPGALASYALRQHRIKTHMAEGPREVRDAARYAYAGGRFELYKLGSRRGRIFSVDINSAYPYAISQLPSLAQGHWHQVDHPSQVERFGVYHVRMTRGRYLESAVSPVFHRDKNHNITFPWMVDTWLWSPEAYWAQRCGAELLEGWVLEETGERPFAFVADMYEQRREWKLAGIAAQIALKLCMNSMYGKLAQRIGWDPVKRRMPPFHQLDWAGWVTSYTRARLFDVMQRIPFEHLIAVETDGLYTSFDPTLLGIHHSEDLGGWEVTEYDEIMYVQSGLAWLHGPNKKGDMVWTDKRRGLDPCRQDHQPEECDCRGVFNVTSCREYLASLEPNPTRTHPWRVYEGQTTRFIGLGLALMAKLGVKSRHCVWETAPREISPALSGKRVHVPGRCRACADGATAAESTHDLVINSQALVDPCSYPHSIPWEDELGHADWRDYQNSLDEWTANLYT
jgi:DNA polymerase type B, organellar and viral